MHFTIQPPVFTIWLQPKMGSAIQAGVLLLVAVLLHSTCIAQADVIQSSHMEKILPGKRPCPDVCYLIYDPICVVGRRTPPTTFSNRCFAGIYACEHREVLWVIRHGPCPCKSQVHFINH